jgi:hypothetical protein
MTLCEKPSEIYPLLHEHRVEFGEFVVVQAGTAPPVVVQENLVDPMPGELLHLVIRQAGQSLHHRLGRLEGEHLPDLRELGVDRVELGTQPLFGNPDVGRT